MNSKKRIAVWQPYFLGGGAEAVALWILDALSDDYDVTLYTLSEIDFSWLDSMYYTHLSAKNIRTETQTPHWLRHVAYSLIANNQSLRMALIYWSIRYFKSISPRYDLVISAFNGLDMGSRGIQYLHWVHVLENYPDKAKPLQKALMNWVNFSYEQLCENFHIANSQFTADRVKKAYGIDSKVIFPPVVTQINTASWEAKENSFLCSGRITKPKQTHRAITILEKIRDRGFDVKLHITGGGGGVYAGGYVREVKRLAQKNADWVKLHKDLSFKDYLEVVASCRYGIHYKPEPFGISIAEMVKADLIPFVRAVGGQVEIVGAENEDLLFTNEAEAVDKITKVLSDKALQEDLKRSLNQRKYLFSTERFSEEIRSVVGQYLETKEQQSREPFCKCSNPISNTAIQSDS